MFRYLYIHFFLFFINFSFSQDNNNILIEVGDFSPICIKSLSVLNPDTIYVFSDTTLFLSTANSHLFSISNGINDYYLFLTDSLLSHISFHSDDSVSFNGHYASFNYFLNDYYKLHKPQFDFRSGFYSINNPDEFEITLHNFINNELFDFYQNHKFFAEFDNYTKLYFEKLIKYEYLNAISFFLFNKYAVLNDTNSVREIINLKEVNTHLLDFDIVKKSLNEITHTELEGYQNYLFHSMVLFSISNYEYSLKNLKEFQQFSKYFFKLICDIDSNSEFILHWLKKYITYYSHLLYEDTLDYLENILTNKQFKYNDVNQIRSVFRGNLSSDLLEQAVFNNNIIHHDFYMENLQGEQQLIDDFIGKTLYIDIWASWCGPCRKQFPFSKELKNKFSKKQLKKIDFIYISIDKDYDKWKKAIKQFDIDGFHFISPSDHLNGAGVYFQANSIPKYIIIDKKGNIVNQNAKRPSDETLFEDLLELIK